MRRRPALLFASLAGVGFLLTTAVIARANNQWSCWHWSDASVGFNNAASGYWGTIITSEMNQWDTGTCMAFPGGSEITGDADFYGGTGWLGLARLLEYNTSTCVIIRAEALMNQSYLDGASYDETDDRHVACQSVTAWGSTTARDRTTRRA